MIDKQKITRPAWAVECRRKGTELRCINGNYYLYEVTSKWNTEKKRSVKITGKLLGKITQADGFVESEKARLRNRQLVVERVQVKEYGVFAIIESLFGDTVKMLQKHFADCWQKIICLAFGRLVHRSALKNMFFHYSHSYLSEQYPDLDLSAKNLSSFLRSLGGERSKIVEFCRSFRRMNDCIIFDGTDIFSCSEKMELPKLSKTKSGVFDNVVNLMCVFSVGQQMPVYYRLLPGNIKDMSAFKISLLESGVKDAVIVIDKGFASADNIKTLEDENLKFIISLPRDSSLIDYQKAKAGNKSLFDGYFKYAGRFIWYYSCTVENKKKNDKKNDQMKVTLFLDEELRNREESDYLERIENKVKNYSVEVFHQKRHVFGTIAIIDNAEKSAQGIYESYKTRGQVETMIDALKNIVDADKTYMQNPQTLEGWMFINLIALKWYYHILNLLKKHELNKNYAPMDLVMMLAEIKKVKINDIWHDAERTKKTSELLAKLNIEHIT
jgi:transposase